MFVAAGVVEFPLLQDIVVIFGFSAAIVWLFSRLRMPSVVGFLAAGVLIGPYGLGVVSSTHEVELLAELGVILLLFAIGMEFSLKDLLASRKLVLLGGAMQVTLTLATVALLMWLLDWSWNRSVFAGCLVALSSTAVVLKTLQDRAEMETPHGRVVLSILIFQDIVIVPMMILTPLLAGGEANVGRELLILSAKVMAIVVAVIVGARYVVPWLMYHITRTRSRELFLLSVVLICIGIAWGTSQLGLSLGLGAFLAGLIISDSEYSHQALDGILPFKEVFSSFFFVSVGMLFDLGYLAANVSTVIMMVAVVLVLKAVLAGGVVVTLGLPTRVALISGLALSQIGEFSFILSRVGVSTGLLDQEAYQAFIAVSIFTMAATPFIIAGAPSFVDKLIGSKAIAATRGEFSDPATADQELRDHLIIIGYGLNGHNLARAAREVDIQHVILEMNSETVRRERQKGRPIRYGDATSREVLLHAGIKKARVVVIAISDPAATRNIVRQVKSMNPSVYLIVRTRFVKEMPDLFEGGANEVIPEEFETSIEIFTRVLARYLVPVDQVERFVETVRADGYGMFRAMATPSARLSDLKRQMPDFEL
ncbi:potassium transporter KefB, partial [candidate division GN15 bacterium]|nr:potassium transporter KefB [candidate division GN15 bacterium]